MRRKNRGHPLHLWCEAHVIIPLIILNEGSTSPGDRVLRQLLDGCHPVRVDRPMRFEISPHPLEHDLSGLSLGNLHSVMQADQAYSAVDEFFKLLKILHHEMAPTAITEDHNAVRSLEGVGLLGPTLELTGLKPQLTGLECRYGKEMSRKTLHQGRCSPNLLRLTRRMTPNPQEALYPLPMNSLVIASRTF